MTSDQKGKNKDITGHTRNNLGEIAGKKPRPACEFCGKPSKNVFFAAYVCSSEECINKAMEARGGPAGHKKNPSKWLEQNK